MERLARNTIYPATPIAATTAMAPPTMIGNDICGVAALTVTVIVTERIMLPLVPVIVT